ncbi:MAG TPA: hypothetical protein VGN61_10395, partial [Verrucomicrobiae bacterium]
MNCIFGLFDVLGFTSFCENCDFPSAERVLKIIDDFETKVPELLLRGLDPENNVPQEKIDLVKKRLKWLTFSDTVFVAMPLEQSDHPEATKFNLIFFTILTAYINRKMFELGLPLRGTVHVGDVVVSQRCFAGKAIVNAHNLSKKCQVAATVVSDEAYKLLFDVFSEPKGYHFMYKEMIIEADVPVDITSIPNSSLFGNSSEKMKTLCWFFLEMGRIERFITPTNLNEYVHSRFTAHGKKLTSHKATMKALNTAQLFQVWGAASDARYR